MLIINRARPLSGLKVAIMWHLNVIINGGGCGIYQGISAEHNEQKIKNRKRRTIRKRQEKHICTTLEASGHKTRRKATMVEEVDLLVN